MIFKYPSIANTSANYALLKLPGGQTFLNNPNEIHIRVANADYMTCTNNNIYPHKIFGIKLGRPAGTQPTANPGRSADDP